MEIICWTCEKNKNHQLEKLKTLAIKAKNKAIENGKRFCIYFDNEDEKFIICDYAIAKEKNYCIQQIFSQFKPIEHYPTNRFDD
jgi:hypothetical protein